MKSIRDKISAIAKFALYNLQFALSLAFFQRAKLLGIYDLWIFNRVVAAGNR
jgi:hypothetical protein